MENPYQAPTGVGERAAASSGVFPAALGLIVMSTISIAVNAFTVVYHVTRAFEFGLDDEVTRRFLFYCLYNAILACYSVPILIGAICMARLKSYLFSMVAACLAAVPFLTPCFVLAIPFGIWAIVVLRRPVVKAAFAAKAGTRSERRITSA